MIAEEEPHIHPDMDDFNRDLRPLLEALKPTATLEEVMHYSVLTRDEATKCLIDLGLFYLQDHPVDARARLFLASIAHQGDPDVDA